MVLNGNVNVHYGTSRTTDLSVSNPLLCWVYLLGVESGGSSLNYGVAGSRLVEDFVKENVIQYNSDTHAYLIIEYGTNDIRQGTSASTFKNKLSSDINYIINTKGWPAKYIVLQNTLWVDSGDFMPDAYGVVIQEVVDQYGLNLADYKAYLRSVGDFTSHFLSDKLHENDFGNRKIADFYKAINLPSLSIDIPSVKIPRKMVING